MGGQVLERVEESAELVHVETVENLGRLAQPEVAHRPRPRAREVTGKLSGSALMRDLTHAQCLIDATVGAVSVPVTLKMRLGPRFR